MQLNQQFKADAGKLHPRLLFEGVPRALLLVIAVLTYGEQKYEAHSWKKVESDRYKDAKWRHMLADLADLGTFDDESGLLHEAHELCNNLFLLQQRVQDMDPETFEKLLRFNPPPTQHKGEAEKVDPSFRVGDLITSRGNPLYYYRVTRVLPNKLRVRAVEKTTRNEETLEHDLDYSNYGEHIE